MTMNEENDDFLSQDEIDALIDDDDGDEEEAETEENGGKGEFLSDKEKDVMGEVANIAMGSAATALYTLLDQKVDITSPSVKVKTFNEVSEQYARPIVLVDVEYTEGLEGYNLLVIKEEDAAIIADLMMGGDGSDPDDELGELHISAVGEAMNQMMGSASTSISSVIDAKVNITPPEARYLDIDEAISDKKFFEGEQELAVISFDLKIGDLIDSQFQQLAPVSFVHRLVEELVDDDVGLTAKGAEPGEGAAEAAMEKLEEEQLEEEVEAEAAETVEEEPVETQPQKQQKQKEPAAAAAAGSSAAAGIDREKSGSGKVSREEEVGVQKADFPDFEEEPGQPLPQNMELIKDVPLQVTVRLGKSRMTIEEILDLGEGSIIELDKLAGETVDLLVNGKLIAKGEVVVIDENFGFRVKDIVSPQERLNNI